MRREITALITCSLALSFWSYPARPTQKPTSQAIVGAWRLDSISYSGPNGALSDPIFGPSPRGMLIYSQSGWMSVQIATANRPVMTKPATRTSGAGTAAKNKQAAEAFDTYYAYFGTWDFNADTSVVTHHLTSSLLPYESGLDYRREVTFDGAHLKLIARSQERGEERQRVLLWTKADSLETRVSAAPVGANDENPAFAAGGVTAVQPAAAVLPSPQASLSAPADAGPPKPVLGAATKYGDIPINYQEAVRKYFLAHLKNPNAVQYQEITEPEQGFVTVIRGSFLMNETQIFGWIVKATVNAKNLNDHYVGFKTYTFLFRGEKIVNERGPSTGTDPNDTAPKH